MCHFLPVHHFEMSCLAGSKVNIQQQSFIKVCPLSSGASVYDCTTGFYLVPYCQPSPPTRFLPITAIGMCHFLPVHHFGMSCLAGSEVNIQLQSFIKVCLRFVESKQSQYIVLSEFLSLRNRIRKLGFELRTERTYTNNSYLYLSLNIHPSIHPSQSVLSIYLCVCVSVCSYLSMSICSYFYVTSSS